MAYEQPHYRRSRRSSLGYTTRLLIGLGTSLALLILLVRMPLPLSGNRLGWTARSVDRIALGQIETDGETPDEKESGKDEGPPPTRQAPLASRSPETGASDDEQASKDPQREEQDSITVVRHISTLSVKDDKPELIGGMGSLYLQITYPPEAQKKGIEGRVKLHFTVDETGEVRRIRVAKSLDPSCDSAAVRALRSVRFRPAKRNGETIPIRMSLPIRFELRSMPEAVQTTQRTPSGG